MNYEDYKKYIVADQKDYGSRAVLLREAIANAKKRAGRISGYRKLWKKQLYKIVRKQNT